MSEAQQEFFEKLKPISNDLKTLSPKITRSNSKQVASLLNDIVQLLQDIDEPEYTLSNPNIIAIIMSVLGVIKAMAIEERSGFQVIVEPCLKIMYYIYTRSLIKISMDPKLTLEFMVFFTSLLDQKSLPTNIPTVSTNSEEIKHLAVKCLSAALPIGHKDAEMDMIGNTGLVQAVQNIAFIPFAAQMTLALLNTIRLESNLQLRLDAIQVLSQLLHNNIQDVDKLANLLPGVVSKLCLTLTQKSGNENHQLVCSLLDAIGETIQAVMRDDLNTTLSEIATFEDIFKKPESSEQQPGAVKILRNKEWYLKAKMQLKITLDQILQLRLYPDWRTRLAFVRFSYKLLAACSRTLDNCVKPLLEMLVLHTDDAYSQVSIECRQNMQSLLTSRSFSLVIMPILKENLYEWIMAFPHYVISKDEQEKTIAMSLMIGMVILLDDEAESVLSNVLSRAADGCMTALEIDKHSLDILEEKSNEKFIDMSGASSDAKKTTPLYPRIRFKNIASDMATAKLNRLLNIIGKHCDLSTWVHHFMRYVSKDSLELNDPQAAYIVHALLSGYYSTDSSFGYSTDDWINSDDDEDIGQNKKAQLEKIAAQVLNDAMQILSDAASTNTTSTALQTTTSLDDESGHVLTVCFGLQIVGLCAYILDCDYLQEQLITILYPLLAHLGSSNLYIHTYALITLDAIALECGLDGAKDLVIQNIDYIINSISQHISILTHNARVPLVLKALIHVGGHSSINYLDDTVEEIYDALERYSLNDWLCTQLCDVLFEVIQTLEKSIPPITAPEATSQEANIPKSPNSDMVSPEILSFMQQDDNSLNDEYTSMEEIGKYFLDRQEKGLHDDLTLDQIMEQGNLPMDMPANDEQEAPKDDDKPIPLTHEQEMAKEIMDKSSHFLTVSSPKLRSQILSLLASGVSILSDHPSELIQLVHSMWPSIVNRFNDPENYVVLHAASLVEKVSQVSTDFLTSKFTVDLWPKFKSLLANGVSAARSDPASTGYSVYSLYHKTQLCLLKTLTRVAYHVPLRQDLIKDILETTRYYYENDQVNEQLEQACQALFAALSTQQADTVWLYQQKSGACLEPPNADLLEPFIVPEWMCAANNNRKTGTLVQFK